jgi:hypothetical protein
MAAFEQHRRHRTPKRSTQITWFARFLVRWFRRIWAAIRQSDDYRSRVERAPLSKASAFRAPLLQRGAPALPVTGTGCPRCRTRRTAAWSAAACWAGSRWRASNSRALDRSYALPIAVAARNSLALVGKVTAFPGRRSHVNLPPALAGGLECRVGIHHDPSRLLGARGDARVFLVYWPCRCRGPKMRV